MWQMSTVATASSGALFVFERICTAIPSELANRMIKRNYQTGEGDWQNSPDRAPLLWLPQRTRLLFFPLLRFRQGFIDFKKTGRVDLEDELSNSTMRIIERAARRVMLIDYSGQVPYKLNDLGYIKRNSQISKYITATKVPD